MKKEHVILGVHIQDRARDAAQVQQLLTKYGCNIKTRIGLHEVDENFCATGGVILLELVGDDKECGELKDQLAAIHGVEVQKLVFEHQ